MIILKKKYLTIAKMNISGESVSLPCYEGFLRILIWKEEPESVSNIFLLEDIQ